MFSKRLTKLLYAVRQKLLTMIKIILLYIIVICHCTNFATFMEPQTVQSVFRSYGNIT